MSKHKYIIKNCPCFVEGIAIKGNEQKTQTCNNHKVRELTYCQDCDDCVMKQIVKKCRKSLEVSYCPIEQEILELLDIQEVE